MDIENLITEWTALFKLYPTVFPSGYFRFLKLSLHESFKNETFIYERGALLLWKQLKRRNGYANKSDFILEKLVVKTQSDGSSYYIMNKFINDVVSKNVCYLKVLKSNDRAIRFYKKFNFTVHMETDNMLIMRLVAKTNETISDGKQT